ncbi:hypothetical protein, partial [Corynebacterium heidelbergense]|uniref:hypothetical protein n=1 Tax=Corynebacterium heidelbergense TaxID=2055947 RepID=UPI001EE73046
MSTHKQTSSQHRDAGRQRLQGQFEEGKHKPLSVAAGVVLLTMSIAACGVPGWAKEQNPEMAVPPAGQLPPLPSSYSVSYTPL